MTHPPGDWAGRILLRLPFPLAKTPERVLINLACSMLGLAALLRVRPDSILATFPWWVAYEWGAFMFLGGIFALYGYWRERMSIERLGYLLVCFACLFYGIVVIARFGWAGVFPGGIYLAIAASKIVRLLVTSAARAAQRRARIDHDRHQEMG
jgi:uncharacterized membrane protein HdeD (DUF308 family)